MSKLVKITSHRDVPKLAAKMMIEHGKVSIGFGPSSRAEDNHRKRMIRKFRDEISIGDVVILYQKNNMVSAIGTIVGECRYDEHNPLGDLGGKIRNPHQRDVRWWTEIKGPFHRSLLPEELVNWVSNQVTIMIKEDFDKNRLVTELEKKGVYIKTN